MRTEHTPGPRPLALSFSLSFGGLLCLGAPLFSGCDPVEPPPFVPLRDTSYDADLDAATIIMTRRDTPGTPDEDAPGVVDLDVDPEFDGGAALPIAIDGQLDEPEWETSVRASSSAVGVGGFSACTLSTLRLVADDTNVYIAIEGTLCAGSIVLFVDTGSPGVSHILTGLSDFDGEVDGASSRILSLVDPDFSPRYAWGTSLMPSSESVASDILGWRELSQDGPHRHFTTDLSACSETACESLVSRSAVGFPSSLQLTARIGTPEDGSTLALPPDPGAGEAITTFSTVALSP